MLRKAFQWPISISEEASYTFVELNDKKINDEREIIGNVCWKLRIAEEAEEVAGHKGSRFHVMSSHFYPVSWGTIAGSLNRADLVTFAHRQRLSMSRK